MNQLGVQERVKMLRCFTEGCSLRSTVRMTGLAKKTVSRFLVEIGKACAEFLDKSMRHLPCKRLECDEIWSFIGCKEGSVREEDKGSLEKGDSWVWIALCSDTKIVPSFHIGKRDAYAAHIFMHDLKSRLAHRVQLTTDRYRAYLIAIEDAFGEDVDFAQISKIYGKPLQEQESRYSPPRCIATQQHVINGKPNKKHISTSLVERQNLTLRMSSRRFTRLTNGFSKKYENHCYALAIHFAFYNYCRIHQSLRVTPAMQADLTDRVWELEDLVALIPNKLPQKRGPYKKS